MVAVLPHRDRRACGWTNAALKMALTLQDFLGIDMLNHATTIERAVTGARVGACVSMGSCTSEPNSKQPAIARSPDSRSMSQS